MHINLIKKVYQNVFAQMFDQKFRYTVDVSNTTEFRFAFLLFVKNDF